LTSGTTKGTTKFIPVTRAMTRSNTKAGLDVLVHHANNFNQSRILGGVGLMLGGSTGLQTLSSGAQAGDLSGIVGKKIPWFMQDRIYPDAELALVSDWEEKIHRLATGALDMDIRAISGIPSWLLILFDKTRELRNERGQSNMPLFPNLELLVHGGVRFDPYRDRFLSLFQNQTVDFREVFPASEGFLAMADRGYGQGLRLILDHGIFYEFVPLDELTSPNPIRHWIKNIVTNINYAVVLTTCAGLWSYVLGDTVRFLDLNPPRVLITGRTAQMMSAFGEHLIIEEVDNAVTEAASAIGVSITEYTVEALFPEKEDELGRHRFYLEFDRLLNRNELMEFRSVLDASLQAVNEDYQAHRSGGYGMDIPEIVPLAPGTFNQWMDSRGKLGGQNKVPRFLLEQDIRHHFTDFLNGLGVFEYPVGDI